MENNGRFFHLKSDKIKISLHPEALMDRDYQTVEIDLSSYMPLQVTWSDWLIEGNRAFSQNITNQSVVAQILSEQTIRLRISPDNSALQPSLTESLNLIDTNLQNAETIFCSNDNVLIAKNKQLSLFYSRHTNQFTFYSSYGTLLLENISNGIYFSPLKPDFGGHRFYAEFTLIKDEAIYGFGGRIMPPCRNRTTVDCFNMKVGRRRGDYGGFAIPFFISSRGYGIFLNNPWPHLYFDMGKTFSDRWFILSPGGEFDLFMIYGPEFSTIIEEFTRIVGRIPVPPKSVLGFWCSSLTFVNDRQVIDTVERLHSEGYPCDVAVLDGPWRGGPNFVSQYSTGQEYPSNDLNWHPDFGDGPKMIQQLKTKNVKTCLHLNSRNFHPDTAQMGITKGLLRQYEQEVVVNLVDEKAIAYYQSLLIPRIQEGVRFWWTDHADRVGGEIAPGIPSRNLFGTLWNRLICDLMNQMGTPNTLCLTRGSGIGGQKYALPWPGDTLSGIDYFREDIWFLINAGLAGFPIVSADLGGFTLSKSLSEYDSEKSRQEEMFNDDNICRRLCQSLFFIPTPRIHNNWDTLPKLPWNCSPEAAMLYRKMLRIRYELTPYFYSYVIHASQTGHPIIRPLIYHHRLDRYVYAIDDEFYLGDWFLIAPVVEKNAHSRKIYLPDGEWIDFWLENEFKGCQTITVQTPLYEPEGLPVFIKKGAVLCRQPFSLTLEDEPPRLLFVDIYPKHHSCQTLQESQQIKTNFEYHIDGKNMKLLFNNPLSERRTYHFTIHTPQTPQKIMFGLHQVFFEHQKKGFSFRCQTKPGENFEVNIVFC